MGAVYLRQHSVANNEGEKAAVQTGEEEIVFN